MENRIQLAWRDYCAHILIPLNKCRVANYHLPWRCSEERHAYEHCQYLDYLRRVEKKKQLEQEVKTANL